MILIHKTNFMDVKLVSRTLDLVEVFAECRRPLPLTELARLLDAPVSSCLALVRTLINRGYLYEVKKRGGYYPTKRLLNAALQIDLGDPLLEVVREYLTQLRDLTDETVVFGKLQETSVVYLDVVESTRAIRYNAKPGEHRSVHANSIGKSLFGQLSVQQRAALAAKLDFRRYTESTLCDLESLIADVEASKRRGWYANVGESAADLAAIAMPVELAGEAYGISVVGPIQRILSHRERYRESLRQVVETLLNDSKLTLDAPP